MLDEEGAIISRILSAVGDGRLDAAALECFVTTPPSRRERRRGRDDAEARSKLGAIRYSVVPAFLSALLDTGKFRAVMHYGKQFFEGEAYARGTPIGAVMNHSGLSKVCSSLALEKCKALDFRGAFIVHRLNIRHAPAECWNDSVTIASAAYRTNALDALKLWMQNVLKEGDAGVACALLSLAHFMRGELYAALHAPEHKAEMKKRVKFLIWAGRQLSSQCAPSETADLWDQVDRACGIAPSVSSAYLAQVGILPSEMDCSRMCDAVCEWIANVIRPLHCEMQVYGSRALPGLWTNRSDFDVTCKCNARTETDSVRESIARAVPEGGVRIVQGARVPVISFDADIQIEAQRFVGCGVDVTFNNDEAVSNTRILGTFISQNIRVLILYRWVKRWAKARGLVDPRRGLNAHAWSVCCVHYLRISGRLGSRRRRSSSQHEMLLLGFFEYFAFKHDYVGKTAVSVWNDAGPLHSGFSRGKRTRREAHARVNPSLIIEDPTTRSRNLASQVSKRSLCRFQCEHARAYCLLFCALEKRDAAFVESVWHDFVG